MSLDTVELVVSFEKYFGLTMPDAAVENMYTPGDVAAWLGQHLGTTSRRESAVRAAVAAQLQAALADTGRVAETTPLLEILPDRTARQRCAAQLMAATGLCLPNLDFPPVAPEAPMGWLAMLFGSARLPPPPSLHTNTLADLINWTVAHNYEQLLRPPFTSQYDVEQAVLGLTVDKCGMEYPEVQLGSSFTNNLGMD